MAKPGDASALSPLNALQALAASGPPGPEAAQRLLSDLERESLLEHAQSLLRRLEPGPGWESFRARLKDAVAVSRARRMSRWQADPHRRTVRLLFRVSGAAAAVHPPALVALLAQSLLDAGLPLAMGLEKTPRPAVQLGHPLPLDVEGRGEWADVVLLHAPEAPLDDLPALVNAGPGAAGGLELLKCLPVPNYATPVAELCRAANWRWPCPAALRPLALPRVEAFLEAERFELEKPGKSGGQKGVKRIEIRSLVEAMAWEGDALTFRTLLQPGQALNPRKLLAAVLGLEPAAIAGLERVSLELAEDPRLLQADRFEPKLHNMYEDAVLLDAGSRIRIVDDDDEPLLSRL